MPMEKVCVIERSVVDRNGTLLLEETRYRGHLEENGGLRLEAYCRKRVPFRAEHESGFAGRKLERKRLEAA